MTTEYTPLDAAEFEELRHAAPEDCPGYKEWFELKQRIVATIEAQTSEITDLRAREEAVASEQQLFHFLEWVATSPKCEICAFNDEGDLTSEDVLAAVQQYREDIRAQVEKERNTDGQ